MTEGSHGQWGASERAEVGNSKKGIYRIRKSRKAIGFMKIREKKESFKMLC